MMKPHSDAQSSQIRGSQTRRLEQASDFNFAAANFGVENETSGEIDDSLLTSGFEIPTVFEQAGQNQPMPHGLPGARGFRARWMAKSQAMHDELSRVDTMSQSQPDSQSVGGWDAIPSDIKRQKLTDAAVVNAKITSEKTESMQIHNNERLASLEAMQRFRNHSIQMPWEKGPLAPVFGAPMPALPAAKTLVSPIVGLVDTLAPTVLFSQGSSVPIGPISKIAFKRIAAAKCVVQEDEMLARCLNPIKSLVEMDLQGTEVGVKLCNMAGGLDEAADVLQMLIDCFARKATATVLKRTSSLRALAGWMVDSNQTTIWSMTEQQLYNFMCALREQHAAPTQASQTLEALNFLDNALKFRKMVCKDLLSSRVVGAAHSMYLEKRKLKQAPRLTEAAVKALEIVCVSNTSLLRTAVLGVLLFCVFASAHWSDFSQLESIWVDRCGGLVLVEAETSRHKTSKSKETKTRLLPFTALGRFCCEEVWGECFVEALNAIKENTGLPLLPSWNDKSGIWAISPMTTAGASLFLKEFLETVLGDEGAAKYGSLSGKPTERKLR